MRDESGFTLVEMVVVVGIIGVLVAIGIPQFLAARERSQDRAAQTALRHALTVAKTIASDGASYSTADAATLTTNGPELTFVDQPAVSGGPAVVSVNPLSTDEWVAAAKSASGRCFAIKDTLTGTFYAAGAGACDAAEPLATGASAPGW